MHIDYQLLFLGIVLFLFLSLPYFGVILSLFGLKWHVDRLVSVLKFVLMYTHKD